MHIAKLLQKLLIETEGNMRVIIILGELDLRLLSALSSFSHNAKTASR